MFRKYAILQLRIYKIFKIKLVQLSTKGGVKLKQQKNISRSMQYTFDIPIRIIAYRPGGLDIMFYSALLGALIVGLLFLLGYGDGHFGLHLTTMRTLFAIPLIVLASFLYSLLRELWVYPKKLLQKSTWTIEELMELTKKDREQTEHIITRVLESSFVVSDENIVSGTP